MTVLAQAISTALLDLVWQGALIGAALWLVLAALRRRSASVRYVVCCGALLLLAALPIVTIATVWTMARAAVGAASAPAEVALPSSVDVTVQPPVPQTLLQIWMVSETPRVAWVDAVHPWILPIWAVGVLVLSIRLTAACRHAARLSRSAVDADPAIAPIVDSLARRVGVTRAIRLRTTSATTTPGVVGWLRPVLLLPPAAALGLTATQLEAVLAHELAHIRRHDYLVNMIQTVVETLFFYHPVVWWTSRQVRLEREVCCDDIAVQACGNAADYARGLTVLARRQLTPLAQAATGGPLVYRVRRLLGLGPRELGVGDLAGIVAMAIAAGGILLHVDRLQAQEPAGRPRFEVTSVKANTSGDGIVLVRTQGSRWTARGFTVAELLRQAYGVQEFQIAGGPDWMDSARFDIAATLPEGMSRPLGSQDSGNLMLRTLLEDRFKLAVHKETRQRPVYALVVANAERGLGPQLTRSTADCTPPRRPGEDCAGLVGPGYIRSRGKTMPEIAVEFSKLTNTGSSLNRLVVDRTRLDGAFNMELRFTPEFIPPMGQRPDWLPAIDQNGPSIFAAVQEQLGLKLDPQQGPVEVLVVDRLDRPTAD